MTPPSWQAVSRPDALVDGHTYAERDRIGSYDSTVKLWDLRCVLALFSLLAYHVRSRSTSSQNRQPIQALEEARDSVQALYVGSSRIMTGSVDGHVRTYDLRKGELRADYIGRTLRHPYFPWR